MASGLERHRWLGWAAVTLLLCFAAGHLLWRGPISIRGHWNLCDFASPWASSRLWLTGQNPYELERLWPTWINSSGAFETDHEFWLALMPPGAYAAMAPLGALPAGAAAIVWLVISALSVVAILGCTLSLAGIPLRSLTAWLFIAAALAMAPMQTMLTVGQLSLPVIALLLLALWLGRGRHDLLAGMALGVAGAIKPQLVAPFFLYYLFFARWRVVLPALALVIGLNLVAIVPMQLRGIPWLADWRNNIAIGSAPAAPNDPTATGPWRQQMIDLRTWLFTVTDSRQAVTGATLVISLALAAAYVALLARARDREDQLLGLATLAALTLLPVYHRAYDAVILAPALAWALCAWSNHRRRPLAAVTLLALSVFFIPFDFLVLVMKRTTALDALAQTGVWRVFIFPHYALATLTVALCMLCAFWLSVRRPRPQAQALEEPEAELEDLVST